MELFLIRHGQSANNANPLVERHQDPPLTDIGAEQVVRLAEWAGPLGLTRIIASPFLRALHTAEELRRTTGVPAEVWVDIHEQGGCCTGPDPTADLIADRYQGRPGMSDSEIRALYPEFQLPVELDHRGWWQSKPFESVADARRRAETVIERTQREFGHTDERIALVFHGMLKCLVLDAMFGGYVTEDDDITVPFNSSISKVVITPEGTQLDFYNGVDHLTAELLTS